MQKCNWQIKETQSRRSENMIKWVNLKDFAKSLGVCPNTFKKRYLPSLPPQHQSGTRKYWTQQVVNETIAKIERGEFTHIPHTEI